MGIGSRDFDLLNSEIVSVLGHSILLKIKVIFQVIRLVLTNFPIRDDCRNIRLIPCQAKS